MVVCRVLSVIVAVECPSAAGKTTWCRATGAPFVAEYARTGREPDESAHIEQARYLAEVNAGRWADALRAERETGTAVCDSDPLKLHYSWCLAAVGAAPIARFDREFAAVREMFAQRSLGFTDVVLLSIPEPAQLIRQRTGDRTRRRRHFDLHARLADPLAEWYAALDSLDPGRVVHGFPDRLDATALPSPRADRHDLDLLNALTQALPAI